MKGGVMPSRRTAGSAATEALSPFELKDHLSALALEAAARRAIPVLDAGRGNPDWVALDARRGFFLLGQCACDWRAATGGDAGAAASFLRAWLADHRETTGAIWLGATMAWARDRLGLSEDALAAPMMAATLGGRYPEPPAILPWVGTVCRAHLASVHGWPASLAAGVRLFATEGASAGIVHLFDALGANGLLVPGDTVAVVTPIFTPYLEIVGAPARGLRLLTLPLEITGPRQLSPATVERLRDPAVRALVVVNPGNPVARALDAASVEAIAAIVEGGRDDLLVISDDVYAPLAPGCAALTTRLPRNTFGVFSYSKFFGATGWRLGLVSMAQDHVADCLLASAPARQRADAAARYRSLGSDPAGLPFLERLVAQSRGVAFHHTAGLSTPQQAQMALLALSALQDTAGAFRAGLQARLRERRAALWRGLGLPVPDIPGHTGYYEWLDLHQLATGWECPGLPPALETSGVELLERLAREHAVVILPGEGFGGGPGTVRVSLANLPPEALSCLGEALRSTVLGRAS
jgi:aspartate 4-decarboxylase